MKKQKYLKRISGLISACLCLISGTCFSANAATLDAYVDNDTNVAGYSNNSHTYTHYSGEWGTYLYTGNNGDSRLRQSTEKASYEWVWNGSIETQGGIHWTAQVYLADSRFTDPAALYEIYKDTIEYIPFASFTINQNTAPNGYSTFSSYRGSPSVTGGFLHPWYACVTNSGRSGVGTGADTFHFRCNY